MKTVLLLCLICLALASCSAATVRKQVPDALYPEAHATCSGCHEAAGAKVVEAASPAETGSSKFCLDCHKYRLNHHPVNFTPAEPVNQAFPLYQGQITCLTCHEIHGGPENKGTSGLLRGGPYPDRRKFCFECHSKERYAGINPHQMLDDHGKLRTVNRQRVCLLCHQLEPDPGIDEANTVLFRADVSFLCWRCHPPMHAETLNRHLFKVPSAAVLSSINRPEIAARYTLPLVPRGRITCSTCHNPHEVGIIAPGPAAAGADSLHRLRDDDICQGCHNN